MIPVEIMLDKMRRIKITRRNMARAENARGMGYIAMLSPQNAGAETLLYLLWAGLLHEDPLLTIDKLDQIIEDAWEKDPMVAERITEATNRALYSQGWLKEEKVADTKNPSP